ncbi:MAG: S8 family serine peptidase [Phycisphaerales bacterium]
MQSNVRVVRGILAAGMWSTLSLVALAGQNPGAVHASKPLFVEKPGTVQFTGRLIVRPGGTVNAAAAVPGAAAIRSAVARARLNEDGMRVVKFYPETDEYLVEVTPADSVAAMVPAARGQVENTRAEALLSTGDYDYVEPDWLCWPTALPNDQFIGSMWHVNTMKMPQAWDISTGLNTIIVTTVDTGVDKSHPDLASRLLPGYVSATGQTEAQGGDVQDVNGHGTGTLGCVGAIGNNGTGVTGMGWNYKLLPVRCSDNEDGTAAQSAILDGARWAAINGAKVVSASFSGVESSAVNSTGTYLKSKNSLFLYAGGNDNINWTNFSWADTIVVGATNPGDTKANFSGYGNGVSVFAPGVNILTTTDGGWYGYESGTSFSTPLTNGVCALIWSVNPGLSPDQVQTILYSSCDRLGNLALSYPAKDPVFSYGRVNAQKALQAAQASIGAPTAVADNTALFLPTTRNMDVLANDVDGSQLGLTIVSFDATTTLGGTVTRLVGAGPSGRDLLKYTPPVTIPPGSPVPPIDSYSYKIKNTVNAVSTVTNTITLFASTDLNAAKTPSSVTAKVRASYFNLAGITPLNALPVWGEQPMVVSRLDSVVVANPGSTSLGGLGIASKGGIVYRGYVNITGDDIYRFYLKSDDGARMYVDGQLVVENDGLHTVFEDSGFLPLKSGYHSFRIEYFQGDDSTASLVFSYESFGALGSAAISKRTIPATAIKHSDCPSDLNLDGVVDDADFVTFATAYDAFLTFDGDLDFDGKTDDLDFVLFASAYDDLVCP